MHINTSCIAHYLKYEEGTGKHSIFKVSVITAQANKYIKDTENKSPNNFFCMDQATLQKPLIQQHKKKTSHSLAVEMVSSSTKSIYTQDQIITSSSFGSAVAKAKTMQPFSSERLLGHSSELPTQRKDLNLTHHVKTQGEMPCSRLPLKSECCEK